jgi:cytochrome c-type biogenesis protein CcmF
MLAEIGLFSLIIALFFALMLVIVPTIGLKRDDVTLQLMAPRYVVGQFLFVACSYLCLTTAFLRDDFTINYVLVNSSLSLPWFYKLCAVWGGHEGSMLLWIVILSVWMLAVGLFSQHLERAIRIRVLVVLGMLSVGFILFLLTTSNPFLRQFQILNSQGRDLNPLLQDPGFLFHPPMLYMGYVGFAVAFSFAIAALWLGRVEAAWAKWTRPWTLAAWSFLTAGITLGSWWAYRELGWGGWWFWDPVENASFMPWLAGTALIHSLIVSAKRQQFMAWTLLLSIAAFSLSLMGTFLVRSGVLTSVHAFAVDPARGMYILLFLMGVIGGSFLLFALRAQGLVAKKKSAFVSRESMLFLNNMILFSAMLTVLMGTIYPLIIDGLSLGKLSVGAPYFNTVFVPLMLPLFLLMGIGLHVKWQQDSLKRVLKRLKYVFLMSLLLPIILLFYCHAFSVTLFIGLLFACWILLSTLKALGSKVKESGVRQIPQAFWGMVLAHCGVAMTVIGITVSSNLGLQDDVRMTLGEIYPFAGYQIQFVSERPLTGENYHGTESQFKISSTHREAVIFPQKRIYNVGKMAMTESAIDVTPFRDIYIALGEPLDKRAWSVRLYYKPFVRWIWGGGFMILAGGLLALIDRRSLRVRVLNSAVPTEGYQVNG